MNLKVLFELLMYQQDLHQYQLSFLVVYIQYEHHRFVE